MTEILYFLFFNVAVEQESSMLFFGIFFLMDFLEIINQVVNLRHIQKLSDHVRRLNKTKSEDVLSDGS